MKWDFHLLVPIGLSTQKFIKDKYGFLVTDISKSKYYYDVTTDIFDFNKIKKIYGFKDDYSVSDFIRRIKNNEQILLKEEPPYYNDSHKAYNLKMILLESQSFFIVI